RRLAARWACKWSPRHPHVLVRCPLPKRGPIFASGEFHHPVPPPQTGSRGEPGPEVCVRCLLCLPAESRDIFQLLSCVSKASGMWFLSISVLAAVPSHIAPFALWVSHKRTKARTEDSPP